MIIIMGSVGSGKSEQTARLSKRLNLSSISTSSLLREHLTPEREAIMKSGGLVGDQEIIELVRPELEKFKNSSEDFILDGFPRSLPQAEWLVEQIRNDHIKFKAIIKLNVSKDVVLERMLKRGRDDDKKEVILNRLDAYNKITVPVVDYLRGQGIQIDEIDGEAAPDQVEADITKVLDSKGD
jgi:adenylate kinase